MQNRAEQRKADQAEQEDRSTPGPEIMAMLGTKKRPGATKILRMKGELPAKETV